ncbi:hypothetical protein A2U01_0028841, partial [Trifolium medium]|nr:hypothetical protein [Trifolium medium]
MSRVLFLVLGWLIRLCCPRGGGFVSVMIVSTDFLSSGRVLFLVVVGVVVVSLYLVDLFRVSVDCLEVGCELRLICL